MKLVIDIPEDVYTRLFDNGVPMSLADGIVIDRAIRLGKPLEKHDVKMLDRIQADIEQMPSELTTDWRRMIRRGSVFRIINKYREGQIDEDSN